MTRVLLAVLALIGLPLAGHAASAPGEEIAVPDYVAYGAPQPGQFGPAPVQLLSADRADVLQVIGQMRSQLSDFAIAPPQTGITAAVDTFTQHWDLVIETTAQQQQESAQSMMGDLMESNTQVINDFLNAPHIQPEPSLFLDPSFTRALMPSDDGFFAP